MTDMTLAQNDCNPDHTTEREDADPGEAWTARLLVPLLTHLESLCSDIVRVEAEFEPQLHETHAAYQKSARNLVHYLALRRHDLRDLQEQLAVLGLSSLGRTESHVLAGLDAVVGILHRVAGRAGHAAQGRAPAIDFSEGRALLHAHTQTLLGLRPAQRGVRIMVTMPTEAAHDYELVKQLLMRGMDCMRINCAHDDRDAWGAMVANLRRAKQEVGRECRVLMDVAGPKLRTGSIAAETQVVKWSPQRDLYGRVTAPAHVWITSIETPAEPPLAVDATLRISNELLGGVRTGDCLTFTDLRGKSRVLEVQKAFGESRWATGTQTAYLRAGGVLQLLHVPKSTHGRKRLGRRKLACRRLTSSFSCSSPAISCS